jgi:hypothetical protein
MKATILRQFVGDSGQIFTVDFIKKDGSVRTMNCRLGVKSKLKGKGAKYDAEARNLLSVYDMQKGAYRTINADTVFAIRCHGISMVLASTK